MNNHSRSAGINDWLFAIAGQASSLDNCVLVTVVETRGSAPREVGCKMLVLRDDCVGTIGGGHLEFKVIEQSRELLTNSNSASQRLVRLPLGASLGQCCGGHVVLLLERLSPSDLTWVDRVKQLRDDGTQALIVTALPVDDCADAANIHSSKIVITEQESSGTLGCAMRDSKALTMAQSLFDQQGPLIAQSQSNLLFDPVNSDQFHVVVFGAGHVGQALIRILQTLPCQVTWVDSRAEMFLDQSLASNVRVMVTDDPVLEVDEALANSFVLVMTHSHQLDFALCERTIQRPDIAFCGLIGSVTKRERFLRRMNARGATHEALRRLTCPIGFEGVQGKHPAHIAVATVAQLLQLVEQHAAQLHSPVVQEVCNDRMKTAGVSL